jgi:hypothetical protein
MSRRAVALAATALAGLLLVSDVDSAPTPVEAWYMYGSTLSSLNSNAYYHGKAFAQAQPEGSQRVLLLDFGAARKIDSNTWGAVDFSNTTFTNAEILAALKSAADGYHDGHSSGYVDIAYGNSNYHMSNAGMGTTAAWYAGYYQSYRAAQLQDYQNAQGYGRETADAGSDMEPSWDGPTITRQLVNGAYGHGWAIYVDYGSADGCPSSGASGGCSNGWDLSDVAYISYYGLALGLPEIYYAVNADQWTAVRHNWDVNHSTNYYFAGATGTAGVGLTAREGWDALAARNPGRVGSELTCFC